MNSAIFFGSNYRTLEAILSCVDVTAVVVERRAINCDLVSCCGLRGIALHCVDDRASLSRVLGGMKSLELGISCGFGVIFSGEHIAAFASGILNIHFGALPAIRGRHPVSWAFLLNHWSVSVSMHLVDQRIDIGELVHSFPVPRSLRDTTLDIEEKIIDRLGEELPRALAALAAGESSPLEEGSYFESLAGKFCDLNSAEHAAEFIYNLFQSQKIYGPLMIDGQTYDDCSLFHEALEFGPGWDLKTCLGGQRVALHRSS